MPDAPANPSFSKGRRFNAGLHVFIAAVAMLVIVLAVNFIASRHFHRFNLVKDTSNQLSSSTHLVLKSLTNQVTITVLFDPAEELFSAVDSLLREYSLASPKLVLDFVDFVVEADKSSRIKTQYHLADEVKNVIIFSANGKTKLVSQAELSEYDFSNLMSGTSNEIKRKAFHGERLFTSAIMTVADPTPAKAYFLMGHGEHDPSNATNERDYGKFASLLRDASMVLAGVSLLGTNEVPADCQLLILAGPLAKIDVAEQEKIERYLNQGGRLLALLPIRSRAGLENLLGRWGVDLGDDMVMDEVNAKPNRPLIVATYGSHPVVRALAQAQLQLLLVGPRSVSKKANLGQSADAPQVTELAMTGESGIAVRDYRNGIRPNLLRDRQGVIPLMVAVEKGTLKGVNQDRGSTRLVVVGESDLLNNQLIENLANREFGWHAVNWLLDRSQLLGGIGPRPVAEFRFQIPPARMNRLQVVLVGGIPGVVLLLGGMVWWRRRH